MDTSTFWAYCCFFWAGDFGVQDECWIAKEDEADYGNDDERGGNDD